MDNAASIRAAAELLNSVSCGQMYVRRSTDQSWAAWQASMGNVVALKVDDPPEHPGVPSAKDDTHGAAEPQVGQDVAMKFHVPLGEAINALTGYSSVSGYFAHEG